MEISYVVIENMYYFEKGEIAIVILKMKLMMMSTYLTFIKKQIKLLTKHQTIYVMKLKKQQMQHELAQEELFRDHPDMMTM